MKTKLSVWRAEDDLKTHEAQTEFILAAVEENDPAFLAQSLAVVARAQGNSEQGEVWDCIALGLKAAGVKELPVTRKVKRVRAKIGQV